MPVSGHRKALKVYVKHPRRNFDVMQIVFLKKKKCSLEKKIKNKKMCLLFYLYLLPFACQMLGGTAEVHFTSWKEHCEE